ncbi:MAG: hypothetical protein IIA72_02305 [Proteobacteria bacterium]|nr:hypothetical protein [Pseudomonadota bacterium]
MAGKRGDQFEDDETISLETRVLRRIPPGRVVKNNTNLRPQSDNFSNHPTGTGTSVSIFVEGSDPLDLLEGHEGFGLVSLTVQDIRDAGLGIIRNPTPDDPNHAHIQGEKNRRVKRRLAKAADWIAAPADLEQ